MGSCCSSDAAAAAANKTNECEKIANKNTATTAMAEEQKRAADDDAKQQEFVTRAELDKWSAEKEHYMRDFFTTTHKQFQTRQRNTNERMEEFKLEFSRLERRIEDVIQELEKTKAMAYSIDKER